MSQTRVLLEMLGPPSAELVDYFDSFDIKKYSKPPFGLLSPKGAVELSLDFRRFHPLAQGLSLVFLDDAETSNHHAYIADGPLKGGILHLTHDGDSFMAFDGLDSYTSRLITLAEAGSDFQDFHYDNEFEPYVKGKDQQALSAALSDLLSGGNQPLAIVYIGALQLEPNDLLLKIAQHEDFYLPEALANAIIREPRPEMRPIAKAISKHPHFQAAEAGERAIEELEGVV